MLNRALFLTIVVCLTMTIATQAGETVLPAGTLLQCTFDEPNFSSRSAEVGDPVLCSANSVRQFEREVFPLGAYVAGHFEEYRDPGRIVGKGWIKLEFDRLVLPDKVVPISARVTSVSHFKVDRDGKILGGGHPKRDAVEWAIPVLWPVKVFTLPLRGASPTFNGESRIILKLLDDLSIAQEKLRGERPRPVESTPFVGHLFQKLPSGSQGGLCETAQVFGPLGSSVSQVTRRDAITKATQDRHPASAPSAAESPGDPEEMNSSGLTLLVLKNGTGYVVTEYWVEAGALRYITSEGVRRALPLAELDLDMTVRLNRERGVRWVLRSPRAER
jgi:hypothetical protein